jgi:hypothetical protein
VFRPVLLDVTPKPATSDLSPKVVLPTCAVLSGLNLQPPICPKTGESPHGPGLRRADVAQIPRAIPRGNVNATAERDDKIP